MYKKILVPLDGSELAECALSHVEAITTGCQVVDVVLLRVIDAVYLPGDYIMSPEERLRYETKRRASSEEYLEQVAERLKCSRAGLNTEVVEGKASECIVDYAENHGVDLIIMATHGRSGIGRFALGSVADRVMRHSGVPVLLVRATGHEAS